MILKMVIAMAAIIFAGFFFIGIVCFVAMFLEKLSMMEWIDEKAESVAGKVKGKRW